MGLDASIDALTGMVGGGLCGESPSCEVQGLGGLSTCAPASLPTVWGGIVDGASELLLTRVSVDILGSGSWTT